MDKLLSEVMYVLTENLCAGGILGWGSGLLGFGFASDGCVCVCVICNAVGKVWKEGEGGLSCWVGFALGLFFSWRWASEEEEARAC